MLAAEDRCYDVAVGVARTLVWVVFAACSAQGGEHVPTPPPSSPPPADASIGLASVAIDASAANADASVAFRPFASPGPPTPAGRKCRDMGGADILHEHARETAALDAELRKQGSMLLPTTLLPYQAPGVPANAANGSVFRGSDGERWMVVARLSSCNAPSPAVALDPSGEVYLAYPEFKPRTTRKVSLCDPACDGCGAEPPPSAWVVEVPEGARFAGRKAVSVPLDVRVRFAGSAGPCLMP